MVQVYKVIVVLLSVLGVQCELGSARKCRHGNEVCVPVRYCPHIRDAINSGADYRNKTSNEYSWCHKSGQELRVCCARESTSAGKRCITASQPPQEGRCVDPEHCTITGRGLRQSRRRNVCYHSDADGKDFYCCPDGNVNEPPKNQTPKKREKRSSEIENAFPTCRRSDGYAGRCVPMRLCDRFGALVLDKNPNFKYESLPPNYKCSSDVSNDTSMCCANPSEPDDFIRYAKARKLHPDGCGLVGMPNRVMGGNETDIGEFPWMANVMRLVGSTKKPFCSGTLIHAQYVLTAAHCVSSKFIPVSVRLGEHDLSKDVDCVENYCVEYTEYKIKEWVVHEKYSKQLGRDDIALISLEKPAQIIKDRIYPICLPVTKHWLTMKPAELIVTGWGLTENGSSSNVLMHANVLTLKDQSDCVDEQMICTRGSKGENNCNGDSGGPLQQVVLYREKYRVVQFGVISGGGKICKLKHKIPGVSVLVGYHIKWILDNMEI